MRVYTFRMPKWMSQLTRACMNIVKKDKKPTTRKK